MAHPNVIHFPDRPGRCAECPKADMCLGFGLEGHDRQGELDIPVRPRVLRKHEKLVSDGDAFHALYAVRSGALKIYKTTENGEEQIVDFCLPGDLIGLEAYHSGQFNSHAIALDTSSVCALERGDIDKLCETSSAFRRAFFKRMSGAIVRGENFVVTLGTRDACQRLAAFLVNLTEYYGDHGYSRAEIVLPMSRADIADYLNLAVETVSRLFSRLQSDGFVRVRRSAVTVLDLDKLYATAGMIPRSARRHAGVQ